MMDKVYGQNVSFEKLMLQSAAALSKQKEKGFLRKEKARSVLT